MKQKQAFLDTEADAWFQRNRDRLGEHDPVTDAIVAAGIKPRHVLEVGCANGWRLDKLRSLYNCQVTGVEPSREAAIDAARLRVPVHQMTASCLPVNNGGFDLVIYGFCLYLADPEDWLLIASEGDRALASGGYLVIHDFADASYGALSEPYSTPYAHRDGINSYHFNFANLWLAHPRYQRKMFVAVSREEGVWILRKKSLIEAIPERK